MPNSPDSNTELNRLSPENVKNLKILLNLKELIDKNGQLIKIRKREGFDETAEIVWENSAKLLAKLKSSINEAIENIYQGISLPQDSELSMSWIQRTFAEVNQYFELDC